MLRAFHVSSQRTTALARVTALEWFEETQSIGSSEKRTGKKAISPGRATSPGRERCLMNRSAAQVAHKTRLIGRVNCDSIASQGLGARARHDFMVHIRAGSEPKALLFVPLLPTAA